MTHTPYFILLALYAGFVASVVAVNVAVLALTAVLQRFWSWQRRRAERTAPVPQGAVANA